ncbi:NAD(P)H-binding protein [Secundilactobacillus folii]|uniref:NAD(P)H-binding protein n=1 Tax=Secundilactobacillus folii TaxID=2678357 RepID=A0A7X2XTR4_9LACO|nr:NAD(P)H-binding protein [Secundilactobacillus folii]MTV81380.1 NAD(P)H-binding protein [Secundilactobacillus folii]
MTRCLILGIDHPVAKLIAARLKGIEVIGFSEDGNSAAQYQGDARKAATYEEAVKDVDVIYSDFTGMDVDWKLEAVFEALRRQRQQVRTVMRSVAGIDHELTGKWTYAGIDDSASFLKQQRYAIKIVDEAEMPYTVLRPLISAKGDTAYQLVNEGQPVAVKPVTPETYAKVAAGEILDGTHVNQSIAIVGKS